MLFRSYKWQNNVMKELRKNRGLADITSDYTKNKPEVKLVIDENKAKDLGLSNQSIGKSIETLFSGKSVTTCADEETTFVLSKVLKTEPLTTPSPFAFRYLES